MNADSVSLPAHNAVVDDLDSLRRSVQIVFGLYMAAIQALIVYLLIKIWPDQIPLPQVDRLEPRTLFGHTHQFSLKIRFLLIVAVPGALGSYLPAATSFVHYFGNRQQGLTS